MHDIDFLPVEYRQKYERWPSQPWLIGASGVLVVLMIVAAFVQHHQKLHVEGELAAIAPAYAEAVDLQNRLIEVQWQRNLASANAELYAYLRRPWSRTELLTALTMTLPDGIALDHVHILHNPPREPTISESQPTASKDVESKRLMPFNPAYRDLTRIRSQLDSVQTVVVLAGTATESPALHRYLSNLNRSNVFEKANLDYFRKVDDGKGGKTLRFRAVLAVQSRYDQFGNPTRPNKKSAAVAVHGDQNHRGVTLGVTKTP